jgi:trimethylamine:corrinoid methyltransferase-like protein
MFDYTKISNRLGLQEWKKTKLDLWQRARKEVKDILQTHHPDPLDKETKEKIRNLVIEAERKIAKS